MSENFIDLSEFDPSERFKRLDRFLTDHISKHKRVPLQPDDFIGIASARNFSFLKFIDVATSPYTSAVDQDILSIPGRAQRLILTMPIKGRFRIVQNGYSHVLEPGELALFDNRLVGSISGMEEGENLLMSTSRSAWSKLTPIPTLDSSFKLNMGSPISRIARRYMMELSSGESNIGSLYQSLLARQMIEIVSAAINERANQTPETAHQKLMVMNIKAFIRNNIGVNPVNIDYISKEFGISNRYLSLIFSKNGEGLKQYISDVKMQMALELLEMSVVDKTSISDIAMRLGYYSHSHFSNAFTARYGMSPSVYRDQIPKEASDRLGPSVIPKSGSI